MQLHSLTLENIRSYRECTLTLEKGSTLLWGDIGSGKSTLLLAIEFALFGTRRTGASLLRHGSKSGSVELVFSVHSKKYHIKRTLKRSASSVGQDEGYLIVDNCKTPATPLELKSKIYALLGYPQGEILKTKNSIFTFTVYTPQEEMKLILSESSEVRLDILRKVFGLEKYKVVKENSQFLLKLFREMYIRYQAQSLPFEGLLAKLQEIKQLILQLEKRKQSLVLQLSVQKNIHDEKKKELVILQEKLLVHASMQSSIAQKSKMYREKQDYNHQLQSEIVSLQSMHKDLLVKLASIKQDPPLDLPSTEVEMFTELKVQEYQIYTNFIVEVKMKLTHLEEKYQECERSKNASHELLLRIKQWNDSLQIFDPFEKQGYVQKKYALEESLILHQSKRHEFEARQKKAEHRLTTLPHMTHCPTCLQQVESAHRQKIMDEEMMAIQEGKDQNALIGKMIQSIHEELKHIHQSIETLSQKEAQNKQIHASLHLLEEQYQNQCEAASALPRLQQQLDQLRIMTLSLESIDDLKEEVTWFKSLLTQYQEYKQSLQLQHALDDRIYDLNLLLQKNLSLQKETQESLQTLMTEISVLSNQVEEGFSLKRKADETLEELDALSTRLTNLHREESALIFEENAAGQQAAALASEEETIKHLREKAEMIQQFRNYFEQYFLELLNSIEKHIFLAAYQRFQTEFEQFFAGLMEDSSITVRIDTEFSPIISQNGYETDYSFLSGGERTSVALAYRLALNTVINDVVSGIHTKNILILDEPTEGLSSLQLINLKKVLDSLSCNQVIIVSHEQSMESFVDHVVTVNKDDHTSSVR